MLREKIAVSALSCDIYQIVLTQHNILFAVHNQVASTPLTVIKRGTKIDLLHVHNTISPIYDTIEDKSYTVLTTKERTFEGRNQTVINSGTINLRRSSNVKRDILAARNSPDKKLSPPNKVLPRLSPTGTGMCTRKHVKSELMKGTYRP